MSERELLGMTGYAPVLLWCDRPKSGEPFCIYGQWDEDIQMWWLYTDAACKNWIGDCEDVADIEHWGPITAEEYRNEDPSLLPMDYPANLG